MRIIVFAIVILIFYFIISNHHDKVIKTIENEHTEYLKKFDYNLMGIVNNIYSKYPFIEKKDESFNVGKTLIFEKSNNTSIVFADNRGLSDERVAYNRKDLKYIIIKKYFETPVGEYDNNATKATRLDVEITIVDVDDLKIVGQSSFTGKAPPDVIRYKGTAPETKSGSVGMTIEDMLDSMNSSSK
ncbi:MAG: hypothetical protein AB7P01_11805 [Bacteroidia bacterium]